MALVVLINPKLGKERNPYREDIAPREPMSILALGSYLANQKTGLEINLIDAVLYEEEYIRGMISDIITKGAKPILFGFSVMTTQISHAIKLSDFVKGLDHSIPIIWGGAHPTLFPKETSMDDSVDIVVHGRGEGPLVEICKQLMTTKEINDDISGTCIKGKLNKSGKPLTMDEYPYLDYELLDIKYYLGPLLHHDAISLEPNRSLHVLSSRGCPWRCAFCINTVTQNTWSPMSSERFLDELAYNIKKFDLDTYRILDDDFFVSKKRSFEIVDGLRKRGITLRWGANVRANYFRDDYMSVDFAKKMRSTGCKALFMGAESGNQGILDLITKDITVEQIIRSADVCNKADITPVYSWMIGIPTQTKRQILDTIDVMVEISRICPSAIHYPLWNFRPFPGGNLYNLCIKSGLHVPKTLRGWSDTGADEDSNTGFYSSNNLPWIRDPDFIEFLIAYANEIPILMNSGLRGTIKGRLLYSTISNWNRYIHKINLASLNLCKSVENFLE